MKRVAILMVGVSVVCAAMAASGATYYADASRADDSGAGTTWANAKRTIQAAVDLATTAGDTVLVTNGVYDAAGAATPGYSLTNRVCITTNITVESVNGSDQQLG